MLEHLQIILRPATPSDAKLVMAWRNDPDTLAAFFHREPKTWPAFVDEFAGYFVHPDLPPLIACIGDPVAFLRFRPASHPFIEQPCHDVCDISINVAPEWRGIGVGSAVLRAVAPVLAKSGYTAILAEIRAENVASRRAFEHAGFGLLGERWRAIEDTGERCRIALYMRIEGK